jgi:hypothetical protein
VSPPCGEKKVARSFAVSHVFEAIHFSQAVQSSRPTWMMHMTANMKREPLSRKTHQRKIRERTFEELVSQSVTLRTSFPWCYYRGFCCFFHSKTLSYAEHYMLRDFTTGTVRHLGVVDKFNTQDAFYSGSMQYLSLRPTLV